LHEQLHFVTDIDSPDIMSSKVEKQLIWHPRQENKFIVGGGSQIALYEWAPDVPEFRLLTSQSDLLNMKTLEI